MASLVNCSCKVLINWSSEWKKKKGSNVLCFKHKNLLKIASLRRATTKINNNNKENNKIQQTPVISLPAVEIICSVTAIL